METSTVPPIFTAPPIPVPPETTNAPVLVVVDAVEFKIFKVPDMNVFPLISISPAAVIVPAIFNEPPIPTPPVTTKAPFVVFVDAVEFVILVIPVTPNVLFI